MSDLNRELRRAICFDQVTAVKCLLAEKAEVNFVDRFEHSWTPLMYAAYWNSFGALKVLLSATADADARNLNGRTALDLVMTKRDCDKTAELLQDYANIRPAPIAPIAPINIAESTRL